MPQMISSARRGGTTEYRVISSVCQYLIANRGFSIEGFAIYHVNVIARAPATRNASWTGAFSPHRACPIRTTFPQLTGRAAA